ncbi:MAG: 2-amino-4-hydroxy-6-hydroxymethyldihydropteridine diphosphokinase [Spirochaetales bacterium]|nr:2-amino-4-hydroxy-6-hydroxymethyldihydropteridine diphosphokinase [Spirochaetales bacterium]
MPFAWLGIGSNIDPEKNIISAAKLLEKSADIVGVSTHYLTPPVDGSNQQHYVNAVWKIYTNLGYNDLKNQLRDIEFRLGRKKAGGKYAAREIDLDILLYGSAPAHHDILQRDFVYGPLLELEPEIVLPGDMRPLKELVPPAVSYPEASVSAFMKKEYPHGSEES